MQVQPDTATMTVIYMYLLQLILTLKQLCYATCDTPINADQVDNILDLSSKDCDETSNITCMAVVLKMSFFLFLQEHN